MENTIANSSQKIAVLGGDTRQMVVAETLAQAGYEAALFGIDCEGHIENATRCTTYEDAVRDAAVIVLPLPYSTDNVRVSCPLGSCDIRLRDLFAQLKPGTIVTGGRLNDTIEALAVQAKVTLYDYYNSEEVSIRNAIPTAEGAVALAMNHLPITLHGSRCTVLGFGRCGRALAQVLNGLQAHVTVTARRAEDLAWIEASGYRACRTGAPEALQNADVIFNTVPHVLLDEEALSLLSPDTLVIDLASRPGGVDLDAATAREIKVVRALSLPGRVAPITAGKILAKEVLSLLEEKGASGEETKS